MTTTFPFFSRPRLYITCLALAAIAGLSSAEPLHEKPGALPTSPGLEHWFASAREVERDLAQGHPGYSLEMKKAHVYAKVLSKGEVIGRFRPETNATNLQSEVITFNVGRALGCGDLFQPAVEMELRGKALGTFRRLVKEADFPEWRREEQRDVLAGLEREPESVRGIYKPTTPANAVKYHGCERMNELPNGGLETNDIIAKYLRHDAPQPEGEMVSLPHIRGRAPAIQLARELSDILLVDAMVGQWDRFSGSNLHLCVDGERVQFRAIDNGGANLDDDQGYMERTMRWVTRFDRTVAEHLLALDSFLRKRSASFRGFTSEKALATALGMEEIDDWKIFKERVHKMAAHVRVARKGGFFET